MRFDWRRVAGAMAVLAVMALAVLACEDGTGVNGNGNGNGDDDDTVINALVREDGSGRGGVTVRLFESGSETAQDTEQTGSNGVASFGELEAGTYDVEIEVPDDVELDDGETARKSVTVADGDTEEVDFDLVGDGAGGGEVFEIGLANLRFSPSDATISVGTTVRWTNNENVGHTVTPDGHSEWNSASLTSSGQTFEHTFDTAGTFDYYCQPHLSQGMTGVIQVEE